MTRALKSFAAALAVASAAVASASTPSPTGSPFTNPIARSNFPSGIHSPLSGSQPLARTSAAFGPVTPVPEPSTWIMLLAGLGMIGLILRERMIRREVEGPASESVHSPGPYYLAPGVFAHA